MHRKIISSKLLWTRKKKGTLENIIENFENTLIAQITVKLPCNNKLY